MNRNNYRIYHDPLRDKIVFFPSGMDQMFGDPGGSLFRNMEGFIARTLLETPEGRERYVARVDEIMKNIYKTDALLKRIDELQARLQPALASVNPGEARGYPGQMERFRQNIKQREKSVNEQLQKLKK